MDDLSTAADPIDGASADYLGRWHRLVSTTNWEKGRIIHEWRQALVDSDAPAAEFSDDAWSRRVGSISGQHVGRLRRVYERFGAVHNDYAGLYWSHFQAAIDWNDAEMWLEGAIHNHWSVADMRRERWEAFGGVEPSPATLVETTTADEDEDAVSSEWQRPSPELTNGEHRGLDEGELQAPPAETSSKSADDRRGRAGSSDSDPRDENEKHSPPPEPVRPFADLPALPDDLNEAFESFKLAILRHKSADWREVTCDTVLRCLDGLKSLAIAPA
jgi:hypothetical protein